MREEGGGKEREKTGGGRGEWREMREGWGEMGGKGENEGVEERKREREKKWGRGGRGQEG